MQILSVQIFYSWKYWRSLTVGANLSNLLLIRKDVDECRTPSGSGDVDCSFEMKLYKNCINADTKTLWEILRYFRSATQILTLRYLYFFVESTRGLPPPPPTETSPSGPDSPAFSQSHSWSHSQSHSWPCRGAAYSHQAQLGATSDILS